MAITSSSTIDEIVAEYVDNCDYDSPASLSKARAFIKACRVLLLKMPKMSSQDRASYALSPELIQKQLEDAQSFAAQTPDTTSASPVTGGGVRHFDFSNLRDECGGGR